ncbi:MAG: CPBP family intramembrane metalloprotease [Chloroflexi bacterium]|nr:CPBP family intramembrane metalloprotease [Chloroflexota bacterium]MCL5274651.1 CPBP family intramembrane metalloprotease [Chloroflexota bacterium]
MKNPLDTKRILIFLGFAFGFAWLGSLVIFLTGGLSNNPLALPLESVVVMGAPAVAHVLTRLVTREGWSDVYLRPRFRQGWRYWVILWVSPALLTIAGAAIFYVVFPEYFDPNLERTRQLLTTSLQAAGQPATAAASINPWMIVIAQTIQAILIAPLVNGLFTFGEEFGWRAYLQPKLMPLGGRAAMVVMGIIWGVWHWPLIAMGHNYGVGYAGGPWLGMLAMLWFTLAVGTLLGWATLRSGSVWPAVIGHAAVNGIAALSVLMTQGQPSPLLGPVPVGLIGSVGFAVVALLIFLYPDALRPAKLSQNKADIIDAR